MNFVSKVVDRYRRVGLVRATRNAVRGLLHRHGPSSIRRVMWNKEFAAGRWKTLDDTAGDCLYPILEKHTMGRAILDLGCGDGNTAVELRADTYSHYMGIDISDVATAKAADRSARSGRGSKNKFAQGDIYDYLPTARYHVILLRESIYYFSFPKIKPILDRYAAFLEPGGVFVVRMLNLDVDAVTHLIESNYEVIEKFLSDEPKAIVLVFRPRIASQGVGLGTGVGSSVVWAFALLEAFLDL